MINFIESYVMYEILYYSVHYIIHKCNIELNHIKTHHKHDDLPKDKIFVYDFIQYAYYWFFDETVIITFSIYAMIYKNDKKMILYGIVNFILFLFLMHYMFHVTELDNYLYNDAKKYHKNHHKTMGNSNYAVGLLLPQIEKLIA